MRAEGFRRVFVDADDRLRSGWAVAIFAFVAAFLGILGAWSLSAVGGPIRPDLGSWQILVLAVGRCAQVAIAVAVGCLCVRQRMADAYLADARRTRHCVQGMAVGTVLIVLITLIPVLAGVATLHLTRSPLSQTLAVGAYSGLVVVLAAFAEELGIRSFLLQQLERGLGRWPAVLLTAGIFGLLHSWNPHITGLALLNITLVGIVLALSVLGTGSLWWATGMHLAWNWVEGFVLGQPVSGLVLPVTLFERQIPSEAVLWTGGIFGPEASAVATAVLLMAALGWARRLRA